MMVSALPVFKVMYMDVGWLDVEGPGDSDFETSLCVEVMMGCEIVV